MNGRKKFFTMSCSGDLSIKRTIHCFIDALEALVKPEEAACRYSEDSIWIPAMLRPLKNPWSFLHEWSFLALNNDNIDVWCRFQSRNFLIDDNFDVRSMWREGWQPDLFRWWQFWCETWGWRLDHLHRRCFQRKARVWYSFQERSGFGEHDRCPPGIVNAVDAQSSN